jgi:hypothetical protein
MPPIPGVLLPSFGYGPTAPGGNTSNISGNQIFIQINKYGDEYINGVDDLDKQTTDSIVKALMQAGKL